MKYPAHSASRSGSGLPWFVPVIVGIVLIVIGATVLANAVAPFLDLNFGQVVVNLGAFLVMWPVLNQFFVTPLMEAIGSRNSELEQTFSEAESLRTRMETMRSEYEARLQATEAQAREQIQAQVREAQALGQQLKSEAAERYDQMILQAEQQIAIERNRVLTDLRLTVAELTLQATEKVLGENMDTERDRRLVDEFLDKAEVPR